LVIVDLLKRTKSVYELFDLVKNKKNKKDPHQHEQKFVQKDKRKLP
jgi:hypothetical protein